MAARQKRLTARFVESVQWEARSHPKTGKPVVSAQRVFDGDGSGLGLVIQPAGAKSWIQGIVIDGKRRWLGLGKYPVVTLARAREKALANQRLIDLGKDPRTERIKEQGIPDFQTLAARVIRMKSKEFSDRSRRQWESSLANYCKPIAGMRVDRIEVQDVLRCVQPHWETKRETASRVRQRIEVVLDQAIALRYRTDANPARLAAAVLPKKRPPVKHFRAIHYSEAGDAIRAVRASGASAAVKNSFEWIVLTACRSAEGREMVWSEIDMDARCWTLPASRTKTGKAHRVPLSGRCVEILEEARALNPDAGEDGLVFPSAKGKPVSNVTHGKLLRELGIDSTLHGFRSVMRTWGAETDAAPAAVLERALAHVNGSKTEQAYDRADMYEQRVGLMQAWADYLAK